MMTEQMTTAVRYIIDNGIDTTALLMNIKEKDGSTMLFNLKLAGCKKEQEVINLVNEYV